MVDVDEPVEEDGTHFFCDFGLKGERAQLVGGCRGFGLQVGCDFCAIVWDKLRIVFTAGEEELADWMVGLVRDDAASDAEVAAVAERDGNVAVCFDAMEALANCVFSSEIVVPSTFIGVVMVAV